METGHINNIALFGTLYDRASGLGTQYSPSPEIALLVLLALKGTATTAQDSLNDALTASKGPINSRVTLFKPIDKLVTRTLNYYKSTAATPEAVADAKGLADRFRGHRLNPRTLPDGNPDPDHVSNAHLGYIQKTETFSLLVSLYSSDPLYAPTGPATTDITVAALTALLVSMKDANQAIDPLVTAILNARTARDKALYGPTTGILDVQEKVKAYAMGAFGAHSPEARMFTSLHFRRY